MKNWRSSYVSVSCHCGNKLPQTWWLNQVYYKCVTSEFWRPEVPVLEELGVVSILLLLDALRIYSLPLPAFPAALNICLLPSNPCFNLHISFSDFDPPASLSRPPSDDLGNRGKSPNPRRLTKPHLQSPSSHIRSHTPRLCGLGYGHLWGPLFCAATLEDCSRVGETKETKGNS